MSRLQVPKNIVLRGSTYYFRKMVGGKRVFRSLGTSNLREAVKNSKMLELELSQTETPTGSTPAAPIQKQPASIDLATFAVQWVNEDVKQRRTSDNAELAFQRLQHHVLPVLGSKPLTSITYRDLKLLRSDVESKGLAVATVYAVMANVRAMLNYAAKVRAITESPWSPDCVPTVPKKVPHPLNQEQLDSILKAAEGDRSKWVWIKTAMLTGMRFGELKRLKWEEVKLDHAHPHALLPKTKSGKPRRVPLGPELVQILRQERERNGSSPFILHQYTGANAITGYLGAKLQKGIAKAVGFHWHIHQLRDTFACRYLDQGGRIEALQSILGHATLEMTQKYGQLSDRAVFEDAERVWGEAESGITDTTQKVEGS